MAQYTLNNNTGTFTLQKQNNTFQFKTNETYVDSDIEIETIVEQAVLNNDIATNTFKVNVPNGSSTQRLIFNFFVDSDGNVVVS